MGKTLKILLGATVLHIRMFGFGSELCWKHLVMSSVFEFLGLVWETRG